MSFVGRVDQLDARDLDREFVLHIQQKLNEALSGVQKWISCGPELEIVAKMWLFYWTTLKTGSSLGQNLLGIRFSESTKIQLILFLMWTMMPKYFNQRSQLMANRWKFSEELGIIWQIFNIVNSVVHLQQGTYPTLKLRLLGLKQCQKSENQGCDRDIGFEYMSRELLWHSFMELLTSTIPLLNLNKAKHALTKYLPAAVRSNSGIVPKMKLSELCGICAQSLVLATKSSSCVHGFCYYCLASALQQNANIFSCPKCFQELNSTSLKFDLVPTNS